MPSKALSMSSFDVIGWRMRRAVARLSGSSASERLAARSTATPQSGWKRSMTFSPIQLAKDSLSQMSSHQAMVTRSPNHWWASSWALMLAQSRRDAIVSSVGAAPSGRLSVRDEARVAPSRSPRPEWRPGRASRRGRGGRSSPRAAPGCAASTRVPTRCRRRGPCGTHEPGGRAVAARRADVDDVERAHRERDQVARQRAASARSGRRRGRSSRSSTRQGCSRARRMPCGTRSVSCHGIL